MKFSLFGIKFSAELLILIGVVYFILVSHTVCGCCNYGLVETFQVLAGSNGPGSNVNSNTNSGSNSRNNVIAHHFISQDASGNAPSPGGGNIASNIKGIVSQREGFTGANTNFGQSSPYDLNKNTPVDTSSWFAPNLTIVPGQTPSSGVQSIMNRPSQQVPLPKDEMLLFANTEFKKECCPNTYSTSSGCACMTTNQYNYLNARGGNNVPYSQY